MIRTALALSVLVAATSIARADDPKTTAAKLDAEARSGHDPAIAVACGKAYLDVYNADPAAADGDKVMFAAAECFELGSSIGAAIQSFEQVKKTWPRSATAAKALLRAGKLYARIAHYDEAATRLEEYATRFAGEQDAAPALVDAVRYRVAFGPDAKAMADANLYVKTWGGKNPSEAIAVQWSLVALLERNGAGDPLIAHLQLLLRQYGAKDPQLARDAYVRIGEELWHRACPIKEIDGVCMKATRTRAPAIAVKQKLLAKNKPTQCGPDSHLRPSLVARDEAKVRLAHAMFNSALALAKGGQGGPADAHAKLLIADRDLESYLAVTFPTKLDFSPDKKDRMQQSLKRFNDFVQVRSRIGSKATQEYEAVLGMKDPTSALAAAARLGQISASFADTLFTAELPADIVTGQFADDKIDAFCDKMAEVAEPLQKHAIEAFSICVSKSIELGVEDDSTRLCDRELVRLAPQEPLASTGDVLPAFAAPMAIVLESPPFVAGAPAAYTAALAKYDAAATAGFTLASCRSISGELAAVAKANPTLAEAHFVAGLALHRCGLVDEAQKAYALALKVRPAFAAAQSNAAEIQYRAGLHDAAQKAWEAAVAADPKLYAAHVALAALQTAAYRALPAAARKSSKLADAIVLHLQSALAVAPERGAAYVQYAAFEAIAGSPRVKFYARAAGAPDRMQPGAQLALGLVYAGQGDVTNANAMFVLAMKLDPTPDVQLASALLKLHTRRYSDALAALTTLKPTYEIQLAIGLAQRGTGKLDLAIAAYDKAIALDGKRAEAPFDQGVAYERRAVTGTGHGGTTKTLAEQKVDLGKARDAYARAAAVAGADPALVAEAKVRADLAGKTIAQLDAAIAAGVK